MELSAQAQLGDDRPVALNVILLDVIKQPATTTNQHQQATSAVMILLVSLEMLSEVIDSIGEQRNLNLGRTRIGVMKTVFGDCSGFRSQIAGIR